MARLNVQKAIETEAKKLRKEIDAVAARIAAAIVRQATGEIGVKVRRQKRRRVVKRKTNAK
jgi:2C-methyl-D-erythritol 2,4-cyclodiphosphate synthase